MDWRAEPQTSTPGREAAALKAVLALAVGLTLFRIAALFATPLELYPDEAQYWLWSRTLHWGYVSKPPMIAWLIAATTAIGGDREAWVRFSAPIVHAGAMLALYPVGRRLYGPSVGLLAAAFYGLMPAVQVSALFIATDAPLMLFLALALWAYVAMLQAAGPRQRLLAAAGLGAALGLAFMAKQAAIYMVMGMVLHALIDRGARRAWGGWTWAAVAAALLVALAPNLVWQATHGFATVTHTTQVNAGWSGSSLFHPGKFLEFVLGQLGVMGPIPFLVMLAGAILLGVRKALWPQDRMLICFALPPLLLVSVQAMVSHAHAHWAAAGYLAGVVLAAAWLIRWRAGGWIGAALVLQGFIAALLLLAVSAPSLVDSAGFGRRLARQRGWAETARLVTSTAGAQTGLTAIAVEDRYLFNELAYYGRAALAVPGAPPLRVRPAPVALNEAELSAPLKPEEGAKVLIAETAGLPPTPRLPGDFRQTAPLGRWIIPLGGRKTRDVRLYLGQDWISGPTIPP